MRSRSDDSSEIIRFFFKKPGFVRMEFIEPHKGAILVYNPEKKAAKLRPFGFWKSLALSLRPDNPLIISSKGHRVDASDIGALLETTKKLRGRGKSEKLGTEAVGGKKTMVVAIEGEGTATVPGNIHRCLLWLDTNTFLPVRTATYDGKGVLIEDVILDDLEINIRFPDSLFEQ
jgi:outer membrane lipoprotein-sorting protein